MEILELNEYVELRPIPKMGRGVFAKKVIQAGTVMSVTPTWELSADDRIKIEGSSISGYWFSHPEKSDHALFAVGILSLLNHSPSPNAKIEWEKGEIGWVGKLVVLSDIQVDEQVFIDYGLPETKLGFS